MKSLLLVPAAALLVGAGVTTALVHPNPPATATIIEPTASASTSSSQPGSPVVPTVSPSTSVSTSTTSTPKSDPILDPSSSVVSGPVDEAGWVTELPAAFVPVMPAATAELETGLPSLHVSPPVPNAYWSQSQCDWLVDTMTADVELDSAASSRDYSAWDLSLGWWYAQAVANWRFMAQLATEACWHGVAINGSEAASAIKDAMGDGWNGHPAHLKLDTPGTFNANWDTEWTDAYQEIALLFAQVPAAPEYFCLESGWGQAYASSCTPATVLSSLGVAGS